MCSRVGRLTSRPIFHELDKTTRGHLFCSFLALVLKKAVEDRILALGRIGSWPEIIADLESLTEIELLNAASHRRSRRSCGRRCAAAGPCARPAAG